MTNQSIHSCQPPTITSTSPQTQGLQGRKRRYGNNKKGLPDDFKPTEFYVICGRGRESFDSIGNKRFRSIVKSFLKEYEGATGKLEKSFIVSKIVRKIQQDGAFVQRKGKQWFEVGDAYAREKVGAQLRDFLHTHYKSSSKAKLEEKKNRVPNPCPTPSSSVLSAPCLERSSSGSSVAVIHDSRDHIPLRITYVSESECDDKSCDSNNLDNKESAAFGNKTAAFHDIDGFHVVFADWSPRPRKPRSSS